MDSRTVCTWLHVAKLISQWVTLHSKIVYMYSEVLTLHITNSQKHRRTSPLQLYTLMYLHPHPFPATLHTNHTVHRSTHPVHPQTYLLVGLFHNVSCPLLVLLFESLRESISLLQVTLALLLRPAGRNNVSLWTAQILQWYSFMDSLGWLVFTTSWFQPKIFFSSNTPPYLTACIPFKCCTYRCTLMCMVQQ